MKTDDLIAVLAQDSAAVSPRRAPGRLVLACLFAVDNPEEGAVRRDVGKLLSALPPRQRRLLQDVKITGLSMEEAAAKSGMSVSAVKVSVHRGLKIMARKVRDEDR